MPREKILRVPRGSDGLWVPEVGWQRGGGNDVQIGIVTADPGANHPYTVVKRWEAEGVTFDGFHGALDRDGINDYIRLLRKARESTWGRDE